MRVKPIQPHEVEKSIPDEIITVFNKHINLNWNSATKSSRIYQIHLVKNIMELLDIPRDEVFQKGYLDVEHIFRKVGWEVEYYKPSYNEAMEAYFEFKQKK